MYSFIIEKDLEVCKMEEIDDQRLIYMLEGGESKFYSYWTEDYLKQLSEYGKKGLLKGFIIVEYEDEPKFIKCVWNKKGFKYSFGETTYKVFTEVV